MQKRESRVQALARVNRIEHTIVEVRGQRVIVDADLAALYGTTTKRLNEQVRRNIRRFPADFMFILTPEEHARLRSQFATSSSVPPGSGHGGRRYEPRVFTEHGAIMAANVLNSPSAVRMSVLVVRAFVQLRETLRSHVQLGRRLDALERKYDTNFTVVFQAIRGLMPPPPTRRKRIGFRPTGRAQVGDR